MVGLVGETVISPAYCYPLAIILGRPISKISSRNRAKIRIERSQNCCLDQNVAGGD